MERKWKLLCRVPYNRPQDFTLKSLKQQTTTSKIPSSTKTFTLTTRRLKSSHGCHRPSSRRSPRTLGNLSRQAKCTDLEAGRLLLRFYKVLDCSRDRDDDKDDLLVPSPTKNKKNDDLSFQYFIVEALKHQEVLARTIAIITTSM